MPRTRQRKKPAACLTGKTTDAAVEFRGVATAAVRVVEDLEEVGVLSFEGAYVKVAPRLPASARGTFDGAAVAEAVRASGAVGVLVAPVFLPEARKPVAEEVARAASPRDAAATWFAAQNGVDSATKEAARDLVFRFLDEEGL